MVNQLLSKIDGVEQLNNILVIGKRPVSVLRLLLRISNTLISKPTEFLFTEAINASSSKGEM